VIGVVSSGQRFAPLAKYLTVGKSGHEADRVAWTEGRNLPTDDPVLAAQVMQATAHENPHVMEPVYHLAVSFDPKDREKATPELMHRVADQLLHDLKLDGHQVMIVAHQDREHMHMHLMINRVHPETSRAWDRWRDRAIIQRSLREQERALGLTEVRGRLYQLPGHAMPERGTLTRGEFRQRSRGDQPFAARAQERLADLRDTSSWSDLHARLAAHGLRLERKGQGIVLTDGEREIKASRIGRDVSFRQLESRLGPYRAPEHSLGHTEEEGVGSPQRPDRTTVRDTPIARAAESVRRMDYAIQLRDAAFHADQVVAGERAKLQRLEWWEGRTRALNVELDRALSGVYSDPLDARRRFDELMKRDGWTAAIQAVGNNPATLGGLALAEQRRRWGATSLIDTAAREKVGGAMHVATELRDASDRLAGVVKSVTGSPAIAAESYTRAIAMTRDRASEAEGIARRSRADRALLPDDATLRRHLGRALSGLAPAEMRQLHDLLTHPQQALAGTLFRATRELVMDRDGPPYW
jgi:hypothetical protein